VQVVGLGIIANITPTVIGDEGIAAHGSFLQIAVGRPGQGGSVGGRFEVHTDGQHKQAGGGSLATKLVADTNIGARRAGGIGHGLGLAAAAGDDASHVRAVAVGINPAGRIRKIHPPLEIGMVRIHAGIIEVHQHIGTAQPQVVIRVERVRRDPDSHAAEIIGQSAPLRPFHFLHPRQAGNGRQAVGRGRHGEHRAKGRTLLIPENPGSQLLQFCARRFARIGKEQHVQRATGGQGFPRHRALEKGQLQLVIGLIRQNRLHSRRRF